MAAGQGGEGSPGESPHYSPYGLAGQQLGELAFKLAPYLASPTKEMPFAPGDTPRWTDDDRQTFWGELMDFEFSVPMLEREVEREAKGDFDRRFPNIVRFHAALPFSEDERRWYVAEHGIVWELDVDKRMDALEKARVEEGTDEEIAIEAQIIALGTQQGVDRRDFVRRWAAWRREVDEFAGQGQIDDARTALDLLGHELLPNTPSA
jgi:hypothetical protein